MLQERDVDTARGLEVARNLSARIEEAEVRGAELAAKLAAVGGTMPLLTGQVKGVEKKVGGPRAGRQAMYTSLGEGIEILVNYR